MINEIGRCVFSSVSETGSQSVANVDLEGRYSPSIASVLISSLQPNGFVFYGNNVLAASRLLSSGSLNAVFNKAENIARPSIFGSPFHISTLLVAVANIPVLCKLTALNREIFEHKELLWFLIEEKLNTFTRAEVIHADNTSEE